MKLTHLHEENQTGHGLIESEAFGGTLPTLPKETQITGPTKQKNIIANIKDEPNYYHVYKLTYPIHTIKNLTKTLKKNMIGDGWYSLLWTNKNTIIIIKNKAFKLPRNQKTIPKHIQHQLIKYGTPKELMPFILKTPNKTKNKQ